MSKKKSSMAELAARRLIEKWRRGTVLWVCVDLFFCSARTDTSSVISSTSRTSMREAAQARRRNATTPVPGPALDSSGAIPNRFRKDGRLPRLSTSCDTSGMKIIKLQVHGWPVGDPRSCCMFTEWSIVVQPHTTTKLLIGPQNQQLVLGQILPAVWEIGSEDHHKNGEVLHPSDNVVNFLTRALRVAGQDHATIKEQLRFWFHLRDVGL